MGLQLTIDKPDSVSRVTPPNTTIMKIIMQQMSNHTPIAVLPLLVLYVDETDINPFSLIRAAIAPSVASPVTKYNSELELPFSYRQFHNCDRIIRFQEILVNR